jgi:hypothetical protein
MTPVELLLMWDGTHVWLCRQALPLPQSLEAAAATDARRKIDFIREKLENENVRGATKDLRLSSTFKLEVTHTHPGTRISLAAYSHQTTAIPQTPHMLKWLQLRVVVVGLGLLGLLETRSNASSQWI